MHYAKPSNFPYGAKGKNSVGLSMFSYTFSETENNLD
jgi:hypothetical protein